MEAKEQLVKMKPEEIGILETYKHKKDSRSYGCSSMLGILFAAVFTSLRLFLPISYWDSSIFVTIYIAALVVAALFLACVIWVESPNKKGQIQLIEQDLKEGYKKVIARRVEKQKISGYEETQRNYGHGTIKTGKIIMSYDMLIDGAAYSANEELYMKVKDGDTIYFHIAPHSGSVLILYD